MNESELRCAIGKEIDIRLLPLMKRIEEVVIRCEGLEQALDLFAADRHSFSTRPCSTCSTISRLIKREWGCVAMRKESAS